ncbi:MAG TPA: gamma-glutamylcyclotransferase family protein [Phycisphaerae bacterium]|nr:gamma-glutamylcyclotransferase family protein [Phycisphaerae bacterium]HUU21453.1 gamma-glutamylcyclotransferase family protein [Phycisphaerae bacterium]
MAQSKPFNLFVYGTLTNPEVFRAVTGLRLERHHARADGIESFYPRKAVLHGYQKISPDRAYLYAVPEPHGRIQGYLIGPLPASRLADLLAYEGRNYSRRTVAVQTKTGREQAIAFVGNLKQLAHAFGFDFRDYYKQEVLLEKKIQVALVEAEQQQLKETEQTARRAVAELHGATIRDLKRRHFDAGGISDYAIRHSLVDEPLPDFSRIVDDPEAEALAPNYLAMVIRQVIFNQFEERIRKSFRYELDQLTPGPNYYERGLSSLAALRLINGQPELVDATIARGLGDLSFGRNRLVDFVRWSIQSADKLYDRRLAERHVRYIQRHKGQGYMPMGAELEFSNIGHSVIHDPQGHAIRDPRYDGFLYFPDFGLDVLTWKLGGHIDDHRDKASHDPRRGFFEVALGNLSIQANISKPLTDDPWVLNQMIHEARRFFRIVPHSVHISFQLRKQQRPVQDRLLPMAAMKCLFAIAGDPVRLSDGRVQILRLVSDEIITADPTPHMLFSEITRRHSSESDESYPSVRAPRDSGRYVQQFKFLRLAPDLNYEPIVLALKGLQISRRPGGFLTPAQYEASPRHRRCFERLLAWGTHPKPIHASERATFLGAVEEGLHSERRGRPAHSGAYIAWAIDQLRAMLARFNALVGQTAHSASRRTEAQRAARARQKSPPTD